MTTACLHWPVRASFLRYLAALPDGRASVSDGAVLTTTDPQDVLYAADPDQSRADLLAFRGDLRLSGHSGLLFVRIANPWLHLEGDRARLTVDEPLTEDGTGPRLTLVSLTMTRHGRGWRGDDVQLCPDGVPLFNNVYAAGAPFDPLVVTDSTDHLEAS